MAAADQRQSRRNAGDGRELVEEVVFRTKQDGRPQDHRRRRRAASTCFSPRRLRTCILRCGAFVGADRRDVNHARADGGGCERHRLGAQGVHRIEFLPPALEQDPDQIDDHIRVARSCLHRALMAHVGLHGMDLPDLAQRLQEAGKLGPAHSDADTVAELRERAHDVTAEKAGAAEHGDKRFQRNGGHARSSCSCAE